MLRICMCNIKMNSADLSLCIYFFVVNWDEHTLCKDDFAYFEARVCCFSYGFKCPHHTFLCLQWLALRGFCCLPRSFSVKLFLISSGRLTHAVQSVLLLQTTTVSYFAVYSLYIMEMNARAIYTRTSVVFFVYDFTSGGSAVLFSHGKL